MLEELVDRLGIQKKTTQVLLELRKLPRRLECGRTREEDADQEQLGVIRN